MAYDVATLANLSDRELTNLSANVDRLALTGSRVQMDEAERLKPLIEQELVARQAAKRPTSSVKATSKSAPKPRAKAKPKAKV